MRQSIETKIEKLIKTMTLEEKISFCSGKDFWTTKEFTKYKIPSIQISDGPHGLRKQELGKDHLGVNESRPATCFPPACAIGSSWDVHLAKKIGEAIAKEAIDQEVKVVLGPGINLKRNPLCGRNFEYYSEDPYLSGELGAAFIGGVQQEGISTSLKHFAANNQENERFISDSIIDERTLRELYLAGFERAVKKGNPDTIMCAYNKINGIHCSGNRYLIEEILRKEWNYQKVVVTDWGGMDERGAAFDVGTDLEMPGSKGTFDHEVLQAVLAGKLDEEKINDSVRRIARLVLTPLPAKKENKLDSEEMYIRHHYLAQKAATQSAVLLKNENKILPLDGKKKTIIIGQMAKKMRFQGTGSSHINPSYVTNVLEVMKKNKFSYAYRKGYYADGSCDERLIERAVKAASSSKQVVIFAGLTRHFESEGFDRANMSLPEGENQLIEAVSAVNSQTVVVLMGGSPVEMPWISKVKAVLMLYLPGQAGGGAAVDLLYGKENPSGKLAETFPVYYTDVPSSSYYNCLKTRSGKKAKEALYLEGIYVGYRYYEKAKKRVAFPFGHGLSYTLFNYDKLSLEDKNLSFLLKNEGRMEGAEVIQLYIQEENPIVHRPLKELKAFKKISLKPEESKRVKLPLEFRSFAYYAVEKKRWCIQSGKYFLLIGSSSKDLRLGMEVYVHEGKEEKFSLEVLRILEKKEMKNQLIQKKSQNTWYDTLEKNYPTKKEFEKLMGQKIQLTGIPKKGNYTLEQSFDEMRDSWLVNLIYKGIECSVGMMYSGIDYTNPQFRMLMSCSTQVPVKNISLISSGRFGRHVAKAIVEAANGHGIRAISYLFFGKRLLHSYQKIK